MFKDKLKASGIHLLLSIFLVSLIIGSTVFFLFPSLFIAVTDFKEVASIIVSVDLVLGPLLTFVVFNSNKKKISLYLDFAVIGAIQLSALFYGAYSLFQIHPVYITFNVDRFSVVTAKDAEPSKAIKKEFNISKLSAGKLAFAKMPEDIEKQNELVLSVITGGEDLELREEYYDSLQNNASEIIASSLDPNLVFKSKGAKDKAKDFLSSYQKELDSVIFIPLDSPNKEAILVMDKKTLLPITTISINPWQLNKS